MMMMGLGMVMMMGFGLIVPLLLIGAVAAALGWRPQSIKSGRAPSSQTPVNILDTRYASGEITRDEYEQMRQDLSG